MFPHNTTNAFSIEFITGAIMGNVKMWMTSCCKNSLTTLGCVGVFM